MGKARKARAAYFLEWSGAKQGNLSILERRGSKAMNGRKRLLMGCLGGGAYVGLELLWRGRSHWSMFLTGGVCFLLIGHLGELERPAPLPVQGILGAGIVTAAELGAGLLVNRDHSVWDYRTMPGSFLGQICVPYSLLWIPVSFLALGLYTGLSRALD